MAELRVRGLRRRLVRLHMVGDAPTVEGIYAGRWDGHYRLLKATLLAAEDASYDLEGEAFVPRDKVLLVQRLR